VKTLPLDLQQIAIAQDRKPGDENNQDISALVGKVGHFASWRNLPQNDPRCLQLSGALCAPTRG